MNSRTSKTVTRREFLKVTSAGIIGFGMLHPLVSVASSSRRPNIVWIMAEDLCVHNLGLYEEGGAPSPTVDAIAKSKSGLVFDNVFCNAPVCSVARTSLFSGCLAPRIGTQYHRRAQLVPLPDGLELFPAYLRRAGYYTSNSTKRDYNCVESGTVWDEPSSRKDAWRNRPSPQTPFFHVSTYMQTHESALHLSREKMRTTVKTNPKSVRIQPQHPDTELFRYTYARQQDCIRQVDQAVAATIDKLREDGLLEDTFVFYFGDNGGTLPGSKGYLYETGLHVPMIARVPENFKNLVPDTSGQPIHGFISFIDFAPTMLNLAGVKAPSQMDGRPFLEPTVTLAELNRRDETFGHADRFDELYYTSRSLRKGNFKYIRNYEPYLPASLRNNYRYKMLAFQQWRQLYQENKLNPAQAKFFEPKGAEELYDLSVDPYETVNLAGNPQFHDRLIDLRTRLQKRIKDLPDVGIIPECVWLLEGGAENPVAYGQRNKQRIARYWDTADLMLMPYDKARKPIENALKSEDPLERFWGLTVCAGAGKTAEDMAGTGRMLTTDTNNLVACRAALFLTRIGNIDPQPVYRKALRQARSAIETLQILNDLVYLKDGGFGYAFNFTGEDVPRIDAEVKRRLLYLGWK